MKFLKQNLLNYRRVLIKNFFLFMQTQQLIKSLKKKEKKYLIIQSTFFV